MSQDISYFLVTEHGDKREKPFCSGMQSISGAFLVALRVFKFTSSGKVEVWVDTTDNENNPFRCLVASFQDAGPKLFAKKNWLPYMGSYDDAKSTLAEVVKMAGGARW